MDDHRVRLLSDSSIEVTKRFDDKGIEEYHLRMANGKTACFKRVDPETHHKLRCKAYSYVFP